MRGHHGAGWRRALTGVLLAGTIAGSFVPGQVGRGASAGVVVLTGTPFPAGLALGVAADPLGVQMALWSPLVGFDDHLKPYAVLAARVPTPANGDVRLVGGGMQVTVATSLIPSASIYHDSSIPVSPVDLPLARRLLRATGYATSLRGPGRHLSLNPVTGNDPTRVREADLLAHDLALVGVRLTPVTVSASPADQGGLYAPYERGGVLTTRHFDLALFDLRLGPDPATVASLFDPDRAPTPLSHGAARRNYTGIDVEALASLPETAQASLDPRSRRLGYAKLQRKVNDLLPYIVLYERPQIVVDDGKVLNLHPAPQDEGAFWNAWEWARL